MWNKAYIDIVFLVTLLDCPCDHHQVLHHMLFVLSAFARSFVFGRYTYISRDYSRYMVYVRVNERTDKRKLIKIRAQIYCSSSCIFLQLFCKLFHANLFIKHFLAVVGIEEIT